MDASCVLVTFEKQTKRNTHEIILFRFRRVEDLDRKRTTRHCHQRTIVEVVLEFAGVERSRHHDNLEIGSLFNHFLQINLCALVGAAP